eukprot:TRINITY_DN12074_c0_g1_i1.p1 TRINITY_DN12074_c0_g1~~TRINITY_DN12074_c0_g1_i1.p1  ORF type:complete len:500 (+),score=123.52 TRINITY_DN12074_c0_g1_i1:2434-3933(+)
MLGVIFMAAATLLLLFVVHKLFNLYVGISAIEKMPGYKFKFPYGTLHRHPNPVEHVKMLRVLSAEHPETGFRFWLGPIQAICVLNHPKLLRKLIEHNPPKSVMLYKYVQPWLGKHSLLTIEGGEWKHMRKLLTPAFHMQILKYYAPVVCEATEIIIDKFIKHGTETDYDVFNDFGLLTLDVVCRAAFSHDGNPQLNPEDRYSQSIGEIAHYVIKRATNPAMMMDTVYFRTQAGKEFQDILDYVHAHADKLISQRAEELKGLTIEDVGRAKTGKRKLLDFLDILLLAKDDNGQGLDKESIRHQCDTFLFAGHDTTSTCLSWMCYALSIRPEIQAKVRQEAVDAFGHDEEPTYEDVQTKLPYMTAVMKEALRMFPPVPGVGRVLEEPLDLGHTVLQPGTNAAIGIYALHHNPEVWPEPDKFDPERFTGKRDYDPYSFLPFSFGRRNCIGQSFAMSEIRIAMVQILRRVKILPSVEADYKPNPMAQVVLRSQNGIRMRFEAL